MEQTREERIKANAQKELDAMAQKNGDWFTEETKNEGEVKPKSSIKTAAPKPEAKPKVEAKPKPEAKPKVEATIPPVE